MERCGYTAGTGYAHWVLGRCSRDRIYLPGGAPHRSAYDVPAYIDAYQP